MLLKRNVDIVRPDWKAKWPAPGLWVDHEFRCKWNSVPWAMVKRRNVMQDIPRSKTLRVKVFVDALPAGAEVTRSKWRWCSSRETTPQNQVGGASTGLRRYQLFGPILGSRRSKRTRVDTIEGVLIQNFYRG